MPSAHRAHLGGDMIRHCGEYATLVWQGGGLVEDELEPHEHVGEPPAAERPPFRESGIASKMGRM
jgi:hypothetical protein